MGIAKAPSSPSGKFVEKTLIGTTFPASARSRLSIPNFPVSPATPMTVPVEVPIPRKILVIRLLGPCADVDTGDE